MQLNDLIIKFSSYGKVSLFQYYSGEFVVKVELNSTMPGLSSELLGEGRTPVEAAIELDNRINIFFAKTDSDDKMSPGNRFLRIS